MSKQLYKMMIEARRRRAGYKIKTIALDNDPTYIFCYAERGLPPSQDKNEPSILFIHALASHKGVWYGMTRHFPSTLHCVALDLPSHGGTTHREDDDFTIDGFCKRIHEFIRAVRLYRVTGGIHLVAHSLGAVIASHYTMKYGETDRVRFVSQLSPSYWTPCKDPFLKATVFLPETPQEEEYHLSMMFHKKRPGGVDQKVWLYALEKDYYGRFRQMWAAVNSDMLSPQKSVLQMSLLKALMPKTARTHLIWGEMNKLTKVTGARYIADALQCRLSIISNAGHYAHIEEGKKTAELVVEYRNNVR